MDKEKIKGLGWADLNALRQLVLEKYVACSYQTTSMKEKTIEDFKLTKEFRDMLTVIEEVIEEKIRSL